jgi:hypothetical protein
LANRGSPSAWCAAAGAVDADAAGGIDFNQSEPPAYTDFAYLRAGG